MSSMQTAVTSTNAQIPKIWWLWILVLSGVAILGGLLMAFSPSILYQSVIRDNYNAFFSTDAFSALNPSQLSFVHWVYGVAGAFTVGWFSMVAMVTVTKLRQGSWLAWKFIAVSITAKGLINLYVGIKAGYMLDIQGQALYMIGFWIPLLGALKHMDRQS